VSDDGDVSFDDMELRAWPCKDLNLRARSSDNRVYAFLA